MSYVVFDMDQTIADITQVYYFLLSLTVKDYTVAFYPNRLHYISPYILDSLHHAYQLFVERIAAKEASNEPIGILRPGMIDQMKRLENSSILNVGIYSNNPYENNVYFIRDLIHQTTNRSIIGPCIHWNHPMRDIDHQLQKYMSKSWITLRTILIDHGARYDLEPEDVFFFDDQIHIAMVKAMGDHYKQVSEYHAIYHMDQISAIYASCIYDANVDVYQLYNSLIDLFHLNDQIEKPDPITLIDLIDLIYHMSERSDHIHPLIKKEESDVGLDQITTTIDQLLNRSVRSELSDRSDRSNDTPSPNRDCIEKCPVQ
jgi:hypothetical protein